MERGTTAFSQGLMVMAMMVVIYTKSYCPYCQKAKVLLDSKGVEYQEIDVTHDVVRLEEMKHRSGRHTVPQIFINEESIGGCDDLYALEKAGQLDKKLSH